MDQKIPPEILNREELALVGEAEMRITLLYGGPCISFHGVYASLVHRLKPPTTTMLATANSVVWSKMLASPNAGLDMGRGVNMSSLCGVHGTIYETASSNSVRYLPAEMRVTRQVIEPRAES
jgi:hypothetical protein